MNTSFLTEKQLDDRLDLPLILPLTKLKATDWLLLGTISIPTNASLTYRFLQLHLIGKTSTLGNSTLTPTRLDQGFGMAYIAIYKSYVVTSDPKSLSRVGTAADAVSADDLGVYQRDTTKDALVLNDSGGQYSFVLVNNTSDYDLRLSVNGTVRMSLS